RAVEPGRLLDEAVIRARLGLLVLCGALALAGAPRHVRAQDETPLPPPKKDKPEVRDAGRVLETAAKLLEVTDEEKSDAGAAAKALRDPSWLVRKLAAIRLQVLGLDGEVAEKLKFLASPGAGDPPKELLDKADAFAATVKLGEGTPAKVDKLDAAQT